MLEGAMIRTPLDGNRRFVTEVFEKDRENLTPRHVVNSRQDWGRIDYRQG